MRRTILMLGGFAALGCTSTGKTLGEKRAHVLAGSKTVVANGGAKMLAPATTAEAKIAFMTRLQETVRAEQYESARRLVLLFPEVATDFHQTKSAADAATPAFQFLGKTVDRELCVTGKPCYPEALQLLDQAEASRRAGNTEAAKSLWTKSVLTAAVMLDRTPAAVDPAYWEKAASLKLVDCDWPEPVVARCKVTAMSRAVIDDQLTPEAALFAMLGVARLDRGEPQAALTALKRAETHCTSVTNQGLLAVLQAKCLASMGQQQAAMTVLVPLAGRTDTLPGVAATALLGSLKLAEGGADQALALLRSSVETTPVSDWPGRTEAEADLALAYLTINKSEDGMKWLRSAREKFIKENKTDHLICTWTNEAGWHRVCNRLADASLAENNARNIEKQH